MSSDGVEKSNTWVRIASLNTEAIVLSRLIFAADCLGVSAQLSFSAFPLPEVQLNFLCASEQRTSGSERAGWSQGFSVSKEICSSTVPTDKIMNWGWYQCIILHILTHGSRCVVSAWIPVSNYLSASAHWCHSFPVINQSPACQGQVTSRWAWLVLNWAPSPILSHGHATMSQQPGATTYQPISSLSTHWKLWSLSDHWNWTIITSYSILFQMSLFYLHMMMSQIWFFLWAAHYRMRGFWLWKVLVTLFT